MDTTIRTVYQCPKCFREIGFRQDVNEIGRTTRSPKCDCGAWMTACKPRPNWPIKEDEPTTFLELTETQIEVLISAGTLQMMEAATDDHEARLKAILGTTLRELDDRRRDLHRARTGKGK